MEDSSKTSSEGEWLTVCSDGSMREEGQQDWNSPTCTHRMVVDTYPLDGYYYGRCKLCGHEAIYPAYADRQGPVERQMLTELDRRGL